MGGDHNSDSTTVGGLELATAAVDHLQSTMALVFFAACLPFYLYFFTLQIFHSPPCPAPPSPRCHPALLGCAELTLPTARLLPAESLRPECCNLPCWSFAGLGWLLACYDAAAYGLWHVVTTDDLMRQPQQPTAHRLGLVTTIKDRASEIYKKVEDQKSSRGRNQDAILAACLYIACRQEDKPRTVKEICSVANGASKKEIGRAKEYIMKQLEIESGQSVGIGTIHAGDFLRRFCSNLGMNNQSVKAAQEAVQKSEEIDIRRSPISIAAAVIYIITQLSEEKKPLRDISTATGVAEGTIRNAYKDLYSHISKIIPSWYAKEEDLRNLCSP